MSEEAVKSNGHNNSLKAMVSQLTTRLEPLGAEALRSGLTAFITPTQLLEVEAVPLEAIRFSRYNFRLSSSQSNLDALSDSIRQRGFVGTLIGRRKGSMVEVAFGERRVKAADQAGLKTIPVQVRELDDAAMFELALEENFLASPLSPLEEAHIFKKMLNEANYSLETIGVRCARPLDYVADSLRLTQYPEIEEALRAGRLEIDSARALAKIEDGVMRLKLLRQAMTLGRGESVPTRFVVTTVGFELPQRNSPITELEAASEARSETPNQLWGANGKSKKTAGRKKSALVLESQYQNLESLVNNFVRDLKHQELATLAETDEWREKSRKLFRMLEDELDTSFKQLKP